MIKNNKTLFISIAQQEMKGFENESLAFTYQVSTGKKGAGEIKNSECTPRGWHRVYSIIGLEHQINSVLVAREWTGEIYSEQLAEQFPDRDWILTRIIQLEGLEPGKNKGGNVDTLERFIYIHGTPDSTKLGTPGSHGCIRLNNRSVIDLANWVATDTLVYIQ
ncbi:L,D-transpeptidase [Legionella quateirensis]|uniref:ErfK/YbiS/YcfS/YnhG protein n=1 Tax=Legionella quateirensis TaxID=45072 RepID=A0A378KT55_9GAMM|nr:L,D-transpeptidase [Legionella quateirensis]KTD50991.1 putative ErfK/YbiS/YcfS/YnhG protein [Legionella quateirensis]STY17763.1 putative ErfK/YbiS/YcfS/YnhG protein [Legionella quateirensis]